MKENIEDLTIGSNPLAECVKAKSSFNAVSLIS
jgi:hypothetical protein